MKIPKYSLYKYETMKRLEEKLREIVIRVAEHADGTSSLWGMYQPEEPHALLTELKQKRKSKITEL